VNYEVAIKSVKPLKTEVERDNSLEQLSNNQPNIQTYPTIRKFHIQEIRSSGALCHGEERGIINYKVVYHVSKNEETMTQ